MTHNLRYEVHMISFRNVQDGGYNVIMGKNNAQPWHISVLEEYLAKLKKSFEAPAGSEFV